MFASNRAIPAGNPAKVKEEISVYMLLMVGHLALENAKQILQKLIRVSRSRSTVLRLDNGYFTIPLTVALLRLKN
jgi:hypothetical protein